MLECFALKKPSINGHSVYTGVCMTEFGWVSSVFFVWGLWLRVSCLENAGSGFKV